MISDDDCWMEWVTLDYDALLQTRLRQTLKLADGSSSNTNKPQTITKLTRTI